MSDRMTQLARAALDYHDRNTCQHETTHRGGFIWTICDDCGRKWADDEGGFVPYSDPPAIAELRAALEAHPAEPVEKTVDVNASVWCSNIDGECVVVSDELWPDSPQPTWHRIATITARVPLPTIPTVAARVET